MRRPLFLLLKAVCRYVWGLISKEGLCHFAQIGLRCGADVIGHDRGIAVVFYEISGCGLICSADVYPVL